MNDTKQATCKERVAKHLKGRIEDIEKLWKMYHDDPEAYDDELGNFSEYGLCFDYVAPRTFGGQRRGYFRYQLSWGGPSDEFRFYCTEGFGIDRIEYWFLDWFDGAKKILTGQAFNLLSEIFEDFKDCGTVQYQYEQAMKDC
jgi:hypothetical protein